MDALTTPSNWQRVRLGDVAKIIGGGTPSTQITSFWNGSINLVYAYRNRHNKICL